MSDCNTSSTDSIAQRYPWRKKPSGWFHEDARSRIRSRSQTYLAAEVMSATPARRATRASSQAASATPAPTTASAARRGRTPKAAQPLPAVPTGESNEYGARGKVNLAQQVDVSGRGDFASRFRSNKGASGTRDGAGATGARTSGRRSRQSSASAAPEEPVAARARRRTTQVITNIEEEAEEVEDDDDDINGALDSDEEDLQYRIGNGYRSSPGKLPSGFHYSEPDSPSEAHAGPSFTDLDTQFGYGNGSFDDEQTPQVRGRAASRRATSIPRRAASLRPPATEEEVEAARPWSFQVFRETIIRWIKWPFLPFRDLYPLLKSFLILLAFLIPVLMVFGPGLEVAMEGGAKMYESLENAVAKMQQRAAQAEDAVHRGIMYDESIPGRVAGLESQVKTLETQVHLMGTHYGLLRTSIEELQGALPQQVYVHQNQETGQFVIPDQFWYALKDKMLYDADLQAGKPVSSSVPSWDSFIRTNQARIDQAVSAAAESTVAHALQSARESGHIISQSTFMDLVEENNARLRSYVSEQFDKQRTSLHMHAGQIAERTATALIARLPTSQSGPSQLHNLALANLARNAELALKSVNYFSAGLGAVTNPYLTSPTHKRQQPNMLASLWTKMPFYDGPQQYPPSAALEKWDEVTDCWCAAESSEKGKAQVGVIMPSRIIPTSLTIEHIPAQGTLDIASAPKDFEVWVLATASAPSLEECTGPAPAKDFVCVGKAAYDIHAPNHVQNFPLWGGEEVGLVQTAVVRVESNWGQDWTCVYRIRMHGQSEVEVMSKAA